VVCGAPRALEEIVRPRRLSGVVVRPLNFTVRRQCGSVEISRPWCGWLSLLRWRSRRSLGFAAWIGLLIVIPETLFRTHC